MVFLHNLWSVTVEAAPWLLVGLVVAGLMKAWLPTRLLQRWLGGSGFGPVVRAAVIGTPLPLCSCSVVPAALALRRGGASKGATVSFLVATPENGADSLALSWALLGPFMTIVRPIAAVASAVMAGGLASMLRDDEPAADAAPAAARAGASCCSSTGPSEPRASCCSSTGSAKPAGSCCSSSKAAEPAAASCCLSEQPSAQASSCCGGEAAAATNAGGCCAGAGEPGAGATTFAQRTIEGVRYAFGKLYRDIAGWLALGLVLAAVMTTLIPQEQLASWGSGLPVMLLMLVIGVPMYICATASTPIAAAMLAAGVSPGTVLVFLLAGPATNLGTVGIIRREMGNAVTVMYLLGVSVGAIAFGLITDAVAGAWRIDVVAQAAHHHGWMPLWLSAGSAVALIALAVGPRLRSLASGPSTPAATGARHAAE